MTKIYDQHRAAFSNVSAYVVLLNGEKVATIAIKFPRDGAGRLYAYVHWFGAEMVRGYAGGYGYDKRTAAVQDAVRKIHDVPEDGANLSEEVAQRRAFHDAIDNAGGEYFDRALIKVGFTVLQAV